MKRALGSIQESPASGRRQDLVDLALAVVGARIVDDVLVSALQVLRRSSGDPVWAILAQVGTNRYQSVAMPGIDPEMLRTLADATCGKQARLGIGSWVASSGKLEGPHWHAVTGPALDHPAVPDIVLACWTRPGRPVPDGENLTRAAMLIAGAVHSARTLESLVDLSCRDPLTHLLNRRGILDVLEREQARALRYHRDLSILYIDLNHFKQINDLHGHCAGDAALEMVADLLSDTVRTSDLIGRLGGDEFLVILPDTNRDAAECIGHRLAGELEKHTLEFRGIRLDLGLSFGAASIQEKGRVREMLDLADRRMLGRKHRGRREPRHRAVPAISRFPKRSLAGGGS